MLYKYDYWHLHNYCDQVSLKKRSNYRNDVYIVVIGHLQYLHTLVEFYKGLKNVLFVVDDTEDAEKVQILRDNGFDVLVNEVSKLNTNGFGNVNYQCTSSKLGAEYLASKEVKYMIRMRSDQIILQLADFINNFKFDKLGFFAYINNTQPHYVEGFESVNKIAAEKYKIDLHDSNLTYNYLMDYCITGPVDEMIKLMSYYENSHIQAPAEHKILLTYFGESGKPFDNTLDAVKSQFYFLLDGLKKHQVDFLMLKQDYNNWTVCLTHDAPNLFLYN